MQIMMFSRMARILPEIVVSAPVLRKWIEEASRNPRLFNHNSRAAASNWAD